MYFIVNIEILKNLIEVVIFERIIFNLNFLFHILIFQI